MSDTETRGRTVDEPFWRSMPKALLESTPVKITYRNGYEEVCRLVDVDGRLYKAFESLRGSLSFYAGKDPVAFKTTRAYRDWAGYVSAQGLDAAHLDALRTGRR